MLEKLRERLGRTPTPMEVKAELGGFCCVYGMIGLMLDGSSRIAAKEHGIPSGTLREYRRRFRGGELQCPGKWKKCMKEVL